MCVVVDSPGRTGRYRGFGRPAAAAAQIGAGGALFSGHAQAHYLCGNITSDVGAANGAVAEAMSDDDRQNGGRKGDGPATGVVVKAKPKTKKPSMYKVLMLNDDYTPMEFVVHVLEAFFHKNREEATSCPQARSRRLRRLHLRSGGNESGAGGRFRAAP